LQKEQVDFEDDLEMPWEEILEQWDRPFLQSLGENRMIGVAELVLVSLFTTSPDYLEVTYCLCNNLPGLIPVKAF
jgi:hypothetical protein